MSSLDTLSGSFSFKVKYTRGFPFPRISVQSFPNIYPVPLPKISVIQKNNKICFLIALGHLITVLYQLAIAIYLQGLLPPANTICGSHEHTSPASASEYHQN